MKITYKQVITLCGLLVLTTLSNAQTYNAPVPYLNDINKEITNISKSTWNYISAAAHAKRARTVDNKRKNLLKTIAKSRKEIAGMPGYKGDASLRDSTVSFLNILYLVLNQDYGKLLNMQEIAEQSYDLMEAYLLAKKEANEKLDQANDRWSEQLKDFAAKNKVTLVNKEDDLSKKLQAAGQVNSYYNAIYLIFFKSFKQELYVLDALKRNDMNALEQNKSTLSDYSTKGLTELDTTKAYKNDGSIRSACMQLLKFYNQEAKDKIDILVDYSLKKENFDKIKAAFNEKNSMAHTQQDVNRYNAALKDLNAAANKANRTNTELNNTRDRLLNNWNNAANSFLQRHIPKS